MWPACWFQPLSMRTSFSAAYVWGQLSFVECCFVTVTLKVMNSIFISIGWTCVFSYAAWTFFIPDNVARYIVCCDRPAFPAIERVLIACFYQLSSEGRLFFRFFACFFSRHLSSLSLPVNYHVQRFFRCFVDCVAGAAASFSGCINISSACRGGGSEFFVSLFIFCRTSLSATQQVFPQFFTLRIV